MTRRHLEIFVTVCECGKMSLAAQKLFISQPTVSQAIAELEATYAVRLFERLSKKLYLTEAGQQLEAYARHLLTTFHDLEASLNQSKGSPLLKLGASITVATCLLPKLLQEFESAFAEIHCHVFVDNTQTIEEQLLSSRLDLGLVEGEVKSPLLEKIPFAQDELILVAAPSHPLASLDHLTIADLSRQSFLLREPGSGTRELFLDHLHTQGITIEEKWICNNSEAIKNAARQGQGLTVLSQLLVQEELAEGSLVKLTIENLLLKRRFHLIYHRNKFLSPSLSAFLHHCQQ